MIVFYWIKYFPLSVFCYLFRLLLQKIHKWTITTINNVLISEYLVYFPYLRAWISDQRQILRVIINLQFQVASRFNINADLGGKFSHRRATVPISKLDLGSIKSFIQDLCPAQCKLRNTIIEHATGWLLFLFIYIYIYNSMSTIK